MFVYKQNFKKNILFTTLLFTFSIIFTFIIIEKYFLENEFKKQVLKSSHTDILKQETYLNTLITNTKKTLIDINNLQLFHEALATEKYDKIEEIFDIISQANIYFMQLRYIDKNGFEKIRFDRERGNLNPIATKKEDLQDKSKLSYFIEAKTKKNIFLSPLNLNEENNQIEFPYNPTIRVILPVLTNDTFDGILVVNLQIKILLDSYLFDTMISNNKGEVILPFDKSTQKFQKNLSVLFPKHYKNILSQNIYVGDDFISYHIESEIENSVLFISKLKDDYFTKFQDDQLKIRIAIFSIVILLSLVFIFYFLQKIDKIFQQFHQKKLEEQIKYSNHEFKSSNTLISENIDPELIISQAKTSMILTDENCDIIYGNEAFTELFGYKLEDVLGKNPRFLTHEDREQTGLPKLEKAINTQSSITVVLRNYTISGKLKYIELSISPIFEKNNNKLKYYLGVHKDVTKEQKILQDLKRIF